MKHETPLTTAIVKLARIRGAAGISVMLPVTSTSVLKNGVGSQRRRTMVSGLEGFVLILHCLSMFMYGRSHGVYAFKVL